MSGCGWRHYLAIGGLALALALPVQAQPVSNDSSTQTSAENVDGQPPSKAEPVDLAPVQNALHGIARALEALGADPNAEREQERAETDLEAQRDMAFWAMLMFFVATAQTILTVAALVFIKLTLDATRDAVKEAEKATEAAQAAATVTQRIGEAQTRAYVQIEKAEIGISQGLLQGIPLVKIQVRNSGNSPARHFQWDFRFRYRINDEFSPVYGNYVAMAVGSTDIASNREIDRTKHLVHRPITIDGHKPIQEEIANVQVEIKLSYSDVFETVYTEIHRYSALLMFGRSAELVRSEYEKEWMPASPEAAGESHNQT